MHKMHISLFFGKGSRNSVNLDSGVNLSHKEPGPNVAQCACGGERTVESECGVREG